MQAPAPMELIEKALGLWKYTVRGKPIPRTEIASLRQLMPARDDNAKEAFRYRKGLRQTIGEMTLSGKLDVAPGRTAGIMVMEVLCGKKDAAHLSMIRELTQRLRFTLGGYNLKEFTALALRADTWLVEMRGQNSEEDIARRRRVEKLLPELMELLANTRKENYEIVVKARKSRVMDPVHEELRQAFLREPTVEEMLEKILSLETRISESWRFLKQFPCPELREMAEIYRLIPEYEKALRKLERRTKNRPLTDEEQGWKKKTEKELSALRRRTNYLWSTFCHSRVSEVDSILSAHSELEEIGGVS